MTIFTLIAIICWFVFLVVWFGSALNTKKNIKSGFGKWLIIRVGFIFLVLILLKIPFFRSLVNYHFTQSQSVGFGLIGDILNIAGVGFAVWARHHLGRNWGSPMTVKKDPELVTSGPYHYVRHPIYTGVLIALLGSAFVISIAWIVIFLFAALYFIYSGKSEEKVMINEFPKTYPSYMKRTKMLIPFIF